MGSDNMHHKRKARNARTLHRRTSKRSPYDKVLIVCEGEKTEPYYFQELIDHYQINTANVVVDSKSGSSPDRVLKRAEDLYKESVKTGDNYDKVFCVFDKDSHKHFISTKKAIEIKKPKGVFVSITSVPCFEYWVLLHYKYSDAPFVRGGSKSICDNVAKEVKIFDKDYKKGARGLFFKLEKNLSIAKKHADMSLKAALSTGTDNPTTNIHELVDYLQNLKK
ncbi:RloB family protein [Thiomicrorhabdus sp. zzn3]|uniref:RloB family protein n=1 Tax=Thiomicrorhabdus sp. zzn3 TaxID=3039775 RepID=UPI0024370924|nr:RloB family protein [Thiomicrorhabdus sp. zzn3]MDG6777692.1 RloB family protein [Thiomicrorhabdus sp. zzn3]